MHTSGALALGTWSERVVTSVVSSVVASLLGRQPPSVADVVVVASAVTSVFPSILFGRHVPLERACDPGPYILAQRVLFDWSRARAPFWAAVGQILLA